MAAASDDESGASEQNCLAVVVDVQECQELRSILSRRNLLNPRLRIGQLESGQMALPLRSEATSAFSPAESDGTSVYLEGKELVVRAVKLPLAKRTQVQGPRKRLVNALKSLLEAGGFWQDDLVQDVPRHWQRHADLVVISDKSFTNPIWNKIDDGLLWRTVARALSADRVARQRAIQPDDYRSPQVELVWGKETWVEHVDNGVRYGFDITHSMFSKGNISEKLRIAKFACHGETVVDMFAGIGYFTLPYLVHAGAEVVHACEWNPDAVSALRRNLASNQVEDRCIIHEGDCRQVCPTDVADRVNLGLVPSSEIAWPRACQALRHDRGGILHVHANVDSAPSRNKKCNQSEAEDLASEGRGSAASERVAKRDIWRRWAETARRQIVEMLREIHNRPWKANVLHIQHVKSYAAHVDHLVLDLECRPSVSNAEAVIVSSPHIRTIP